MGCYLIPVLGAIIHYSVRKNKTKHDVWLSRLLLGGALFGVVDHAWNGELFLFGPNLLSDLLLGVLITTTIFATWSVMVIVDKMKEAHTLGAKA